MFSCSLVLFAAITPDVTVEEGATAVICINVTEPPLHASLPASVSVAVSTQDGSAGNQLTLYQPMTANAVMTFVNSP